MLTTTPDFYSRYERHLDLPGFGVEGQKSLLSSTVLIIGAGGLGCPVAIYLAAAGVGHLIIADDDKVSLSNLQRQIAYVSSDIGQPKVNVLAARLHQQNPHVRITPHNMRLTRETIFTLEENIDLIIDCTDSFESRYAINEAAVRFGVPFLSGSVIYQSGQVALFAGHLPEGPCYRCLYPIAPSTDIAPTCTESAVLGPVCGVIGSLMAVKAINYLAHPKIESKYMLFMYEGNEGHTYSSHIKKSEVCPICNVG
ncbi:MAG: HesA/MoeB/ThiF family protein [Pseudomonadota bacterium]